MSSTILIRHSSTSGSVPATLGHGELAINTTDGRLFYGKVSSVGEFIFGGGGSGSLSGGTTDYIPLWSSSTSLTSSYLLQSGGILKTTSSYGGLGLAGLYLDLATGFYCFGDVLGSSSNGINLNTTSGQNIFYASDGINNLNLELNASSNYIRTNSGNNGLKLDFANNLYKFGDYNDSNLGTKIVVDDTTQTVTITGSVLLNTITTSPQSNVVTIDTATGQLYYTASSAFGGGGGASFPYTGSAVITGSLVVTGSTISTLGFTGSLQGTASYVTSSNVYGPYGGDSILSASYAATASFSQQASDVILTVINQSGAQINKGIVVRITGSNNSSDTPRIGVADYTNDNLSANTLGLVIANIPNGGTGSVMTEGLFKGYDTSTPGWSTGQVLYLGSSGSITGSAPQAPLHSVRLGQVTRVQAVNGAIYVRIDNGYELDELHDVKITSATTGDLLTRSGSVWINSQSLSGSYTISGSLVITGSLTTNDGVNIQTLTASYISASSGITGSLFGTASYSLSTLAAGTAGDIQFKGSTGNLASASFGSGYFTWLESNNNAGNKRSGSLNIGPPVPNGQSLSNNPLSISHNINDYAQINMQNLNAGNAASSDIIATADNGNDTSNYVDLGINSSTYNQAAYNIGGANDSYLVSAGGKLTIGTDNAYDLVFHTNGSTSTKERMRITSAGVTKITGSLVITGSLITDDGVYVQTITASFISASSGITGSLFGTATTASYVVTAQTASYVLQAVSASFATLAQTANTASYVVTAQTASYVVTALTASRVTSSAVFGPNGANSILSSSYALSASYASNGGVTQIVAGTNITISPTSGTGSITINSTATSGLTTGQVVAITSGYSNLF